MSIRQATIEDVSRICEILIFDKRMHYRQIFHNDAYSFGELQVLSMAKDYVNNPSSLNSIWVYEEEFVKGLIHIDGKEIVELYVDYFFQNQGIGNQLIEFAIERFDVNFLWVLEKNPKAIAFYKTHNFIDSGKWKYEEGTTEHLLCFERVK